MDRYTHYPRVSYDPRHSRKITVETGKPTLILRLSHPPSLEWRDAFTKLRREGRFSYDASWGSTERSGGKYYVLIRPCPPDRNGVNRVIEEVTRQIGEASQRVAAAETARLRETLDRENQARNRKRDAIRQFDDATGTPWWRRIFG